MFAIQECDEEEDKGKVWVKALGSYGAHEDGELSLKQGELILLLGTRSRRPSRPS